MTPFPAHKVKTVRLIFALLFASAALISCGTDSSRLTGPKPTRVTWFTRAGNYSNINLYLNALYAGTFSGWLSGTPECGMPSGVGRITVDVEPNQAYGWRATALIPNFSGGQTEVSFVGTYFTLKPGQCALFELT